MSRQVVEFVDFRKHMRLVEVVDAFQLREDRPVVWLQKICIYILKRLGAFYNKETVEIQRSTIDGRTFMDRIFRQQRTLIGLFNTHPDRLLIGAEDYAELMKETAITIPFSFRAEYNSPDQIHGLTVEVIPWMRGVLVMPRETPYLFQPRRF